MDRDVYLILLGAGISLASSIVTLVLQFLLGLFNERMRSKREEGRQRLHEIRAALMDKSLYDDTYGIPREVAPEDERKLILDLEWGLAEEIEITLLLLRFTKGKERLEFMARAIKRPWVWISMAAGILVFIVWTCNMIFR
ncbi:MAG: hypothetical protein JW730_15440 [Anaerolineales bacterium]|nr:hypothetical protein [Anaerolineales bacterium]